jgi:AraC-like DNA-binding protein
MHERRHTVVDTAPLHGADAFERLQEQSRKSPMPWSVEYLGGAVRSRAEIIGMEGGSVIRGQATPTFTSERTVKDIARSDADFYYLVLIRSGAMVLRQGDETSVMRAGEIGIMSGQEPGSICPASPRTAKYLTLAMVGDACTQLKGIESRLGRLIIPRTRGSDVLRQCLSALANDFSEHSVDEAAALFTACTHLLTAQCWSLSNAPKRPLPNHRAAAMLRFVDGHIADPSLSVAMVADAQGVSQRRIHQMFAEVGSTFGGYVTEWRVRCAAADIHSSQHPIADIAYRHGFSELSTFRRAFRRSLGCTPTEFRRTRLGDRR